MALLIGLFIAMFIHFLGWILEQSMNPVGKPTPTLFSSSFASKIASTQVQ